MERAPLFTVCEPFGGDDSPRSELHRPSNVGAKTHHRAFLGACRRLDDESVETVQQQQECAVDGSLSARPWIECQQVASRWEMNHGKADKVGALLKERLLESESTALSSMPTAASSSSIASTMV